MDAETTKEEEAGTRNEKRKRKSRRDAQERDPFQVLGQRGQQAAVSKTVFKQCEAQIAKSRKHDRASQPNLETVKEETVDVELESKEKIVDERQNGSCGDPV